MIDYYKILNVNEDFTKEELKKKYHKLCLQYHPDKNNGNCENEFKEINEAYGILSDDIKRKEYDIKKRFHFLHGIEFTEDEINLLNKYYSDFINSNEYKLCLLLFKSIPSSVKEKIKKKFIKSNEIIQSPKWIDIHELNEDFTIKLIISENDYINNVLKHININTKWGLCYLFIRCYEQILFINNEDYILKIQLIK